MLMPRKQKGFTLVEIAIVLVIIGLLLAGVMKGQELINSAKVKNMINDFRTVSAIVSGYQDRFRVLPGDQSQAQLAAAFGSSATVTACTPLAAGLCAPNNGRIDGNWNSTSVAEESYVFWQHVRKANLLTGPIDINDANYLPRNADGGRIGVESGINSAGVSAPWIAGMRGSFFVCMDGVLGRYAKQIDVVMDDGNTASGSVMSMASAGAGRGSSAVAAASVVDGEQYIVCASF